MVNGWLRLAVLICLFTLGTRSAWPLDPASRITQYGHAAWRSSEGYFDIRPAALAQTKDGYLWIGSASALGAVNGRILYKNGHTASLGKAFGLPCERVISFTFDLAGNLWMPSTCGTIEVSREDWQRWRNDPRAQVKPVVFDAINGVRWTAAPLNYAADVTPDRRVWFATGGDLQIVVSSVTFTIAPAWFRTRWFMAVYLLLAAAFLYGLYWVRVNELRNRLRLRYETRLEERTRVARDLQDTLLQTIQGTRLVVEEALQGNEDVAKLHGVVERIHEWLSRAIVEGRAALTALRSGSDAGDLGDKLRDAAEDCSKLSGMTVRLDIVGAPTELPANASEEIFRIGYEAIRNACAHSHGSILAIQLSYGKVFKLSVKDNGGGMDANHVSGRASGHYGIDGMRERAARVGGSLVVHSTPENGTEVILSTRIRPEASERMM